MDETIFMRRAIALSSRAAKSGGGPFGAVVVLGGRIIGEGMNGVVAGHDPTAHAEIAAIRAACKTIGNHSLAGGTIYSSCEPCPMCLAAIWWSRLGQIRYGTTRENAASIGFDDETFYRELARPPIERLVPAAQMCGDEAARVFDEWVSDLGRVLY